MSSVVVRVVIIENIREHPNAQTLEIGEVGGWQVCVRKGEYESGDAVIYFPPGTIIEPDVAEALNIRQYLSEKTDIHGEGVLVVHQVRLRGEPSFGLVQKSATQNIGQDVSDIYKARKYEPPVRHTAGDAVPEHPMFLRYTDVENLRNFPCVFTKDEEVSISEKIHGSCSRLGIIYDESTQSYVSVAGSRTLQRKVPGNVEGSKTNIYWYPWTLLSVQKLLQELGHDGHKQVILYGEVFGSGVQSFTYGRKGIDFRAFDLYVDGKFLDVQDFRGICSEFEVLCVPELYIGPYSFDVVQQCASGESTLGGNIKEGCVIRPAIERRDPTVGRVITKFLSDSYLFSKDHTQRDSTDV
jgi:RNA ligase (TIGR02306 family)